MKAVKRNLGRITKNSPPDDYRHNQKKKIMNVNSEKILEITEEEILTTLKGMKNNKTPEMDGWNIN